MLVTVALTVAVPPPPPPAFWKAPAAEANASEVRAEQLGSRLILSWVYATEVAGSTVHHRVQVVDRGSTM